MLLDMVVVGLRYCCGFSWIMLWLLLGWVVVVRMGSGCRFFELLNGWVAIG